jgi:hypothetical protein
MMEFLRSILENQIFSGIMGGSVVVSILYWFREVPVRLYRLLSWHLTTELTVFSEDVSFEALDSWLAQRDAAKRARTLRLISKWDDNNRRDQFQVTFGLGAHWLWYKARPVLIERELANKDNPPVGAGRRQETLKVKTIGRSHKLIFDLIEEVVAHHYGDLSNFITVYLYRGYWRQVARKDKRSLNTIAMSETQKAELVQDIERFLEARAWYTEHGVPYRRGYLLYGPPGCGKTSLVFALASYLSKRIYVLNMGSISDDDGLIDAMTSVPEDAILLIEDIDAAQKDRATQVVQEEPPSAIGGSENKKKVEAKKLTMSGLLNAIDGVFSAEGRILVMTTNYEDRIDKALLRPGRADVRVPVMEIEEEEALAMCQRFGVEEIPKNIAPDIPVPAAQLQEELLRRRVA